MGMFGSGGRTAAYQATGLERPKLGGQLLNLLGMNLLGVDFEGQRLGRAVAQKRNEFMSDLEGQTQPGYSQGPQVGVTVPEAGQTAELPQFQLPQRTRDPININSPSLPALAIQAQRLGIPLTGLLDVLKAQQPNWQIGPDGNPINTHASTAPRASAVNGIRPTADGGAEPVRGYADALAGIEGAKTGAQEQQKAAYDLVEIPQRDGSTIKVPRLIATQILSRRFGDQGAGAGEGFGQSQTPAEASAAKIRGDARANSQVTLPSDLNSVDTAITSATELLKHPALDKRTGLWSVLPAIPGTPGAAFEAYKKQVLGQGFLDARTALKGAGQVTDFEGKKAEQAKIRMDAAQTPEDFKAALSDYIGSLQRGRAIMQQRAGDGGSTPAPRPTATNLSSISAADRMAEARRRHLIP